MSDRGSRTWTLSLLTALALLSGILAEPAAAAPDHPFEGQMTACGSAQFSKPSSTALDDYGDLYVVDVANGQLDVFGPSGECLETVSGLSSPKDVAVDSNGVVYVVEDSPPPKLSNGLLVKLTPSEYPPTASTTWSAPAPLVEGAEGENLRSVAVDQATDHVFFTRQTRIWELKSAAEGSTFAGEIKNLGNATGVAVSATTGDIYVADRLGGAVFRFDGATHLLEQANFGADRPQGPFPIQSVESLALDETDGHVLVWEGVEHLIDEFDESGQFVTEIGPTFGTNTTLNGPTGPEFAVDNGGASPHRGRVYVPSIWIQPGRVFLYGPLEEPKPIVVTTGATADGAGNAVLRGEVNPNGLELSDCSFEYLAEQAFEESGFATAEAVPCAESPGEIGSGSAPVAVHVELSGLAPGPYAFRLTATNSNGPVSGEALRFGPPQAETRKAAAVRRTEATLRGTVDTNGLATDYFFEYGPDASYGSVTPTTHLAGSNAANAVQVVVGGLSPGQTYHYRLVARNEAGSDTGDDMAVTTLQAETADLDCPNASLRQGLSALLPDCRAYELVSPARMGAHPPGWLSGPLEAGAFPTQLANEDSVLFQVETIGGTPGNGSIDAYAATRGPEGWSRELYSPLAGEAVFLSPGGVSADHRFSFWQVGAGSLAKAPETTYVRGPMGFEPVGVGSFGTDYSAVGRWIAPGGSHIIFTSKAQLELNAPAAGEEAIYDRSPGGPTTVLSVLPGGGPAAEVEYLGASADGSAVAFLAKTEGVTHLYFHKAGVTRDLASGQAGFAGLSSDGNRMFFDLGGALYAFDLQGETTSEIASGSQATFVNVSADGSHAYFRSTAVLPESGANGLGEEAVGGGDNLYVWEAATQRTHFVATLDPLDFTEFAGTKNYHLGKWVEAVSPVLNGLGTGPAQDPSRSTPDGTVLVFQSHADLAGSEGGGHSQIFRYNAVDGSLDCVSCSPAGDPPSADAELELTRFTTFGTPLDTLVPLANVSEDGSAVFFMTADPLVPRDVNEALDVYEWRDGRVSLISSGQEGDSYLYAVSPRAKDVFFTTAQSLVPADDVEEGLVSLYDARVDGGLSEAPPHPACAGDGCQSAGAPPPPPPPSPASEDVNGEGAPEPGRRCPRGKRKVRRGGKVRCVARHSHRHHHSGHSRHAKKSQKGGAK